MKQFLGKTVVITGGCKGLGKSIAEKFLNEGAKVVILDWEFLEATKQELLDKGVCNVLKVDVSSESEVIKVFNTIEKVDVLINNAGIQPVDDFLSMPKDNWDKMMDVNIGSVFNCTRMAAKNMIKNSIKGAIVNISTIDSIRPSLGHTHYSASKAAINSMTLSLSQEFGKYEIRVNAIAPGLINRSTLKEDWPDGVERFLNVAALPYIPEAEDIANACAFLSSENSRSITGVLLPVDCGVLAAKPY